MLSLNRSLSLKFVIKFRAPESYYIIILSTTHIVHRRAKSKENFISCQPMQICNGCLDSHYPKQNNWNTIVSHIQNQKKNYEHMHNV